MNQKTRENKYRMQAESSFNEAISIADQAHQAVIQAQAGLTVQEIEWAQTMIQKALHQVYHAQVLGIPPSQEALLQLQGERDRLLQEYQLFDEWQ